MKSLKDISLQITEEEYRNDGFMHYSTLQTYERLGFHSIPTLFDKKESESLIFGSVVDTLMTDAPDEFEKQYLVADLDVDTSSTLINVTKGLFNLYNETSNSLDAIPTSTLIAALDAVDYGKTWYPNTRVDKLKKAGSEYYRLMYLAKGKTVISSAMYNDALACVKSLHESPATKQLFAVSNPFEPEIERCYQIKFRNTFDGITYTIMAD